MAALAQTSADHTCTCMTASAGCCQAKKERLEDWSTALADASRRAEHLALAFEDAGARTGDVGMSLIRLGRFQVRAAVAGRMNGA